MVYNGHFPIYLIECFEVKRVTTMSHLPQVHITMTILVTNDHIYDVKYEVKRASHILQLPLIN
jgi:hypothetical protein